MNLKKVATRLAFISMLTMILAVTLVSAQPHNWLDPGPGPHVDSHWWDITIDDDLRLQKALACENDLIGVPYPEAMDDLMAAGFTLTTSQSDGYTMFFENNRVWPTGGPDGTGHPYDRSINFRKGLHRLIPKAEYVALYAPLNSACEWWANPHQTYWTNPACPAPTYDPVAASAYLDAGGFTEDPALGTNPYYDSAYEWSAEYLRKDPEMGGPVAFEYYAIGPVEAPIGFEGAQLITEHFRMAGLTVDLVAGTWLGLVIRLVNDDLYDYQVMTGVGVTNQGIAPDFMYDLSYSENLPLWNWAGMNITEADEAGLRMMGTLSVAVCRQAAFDLQAIFVEHEPFMPILLWENWVATKGPSRESYPLGDITWPAEGHPGLVGVVVRKAGGAGASSNVFGKMLTRGDRTDLPTLNEERNIWATGAYLDTLNPLTADTVPDWQTLANVFEGSYSRNPYTMDYMWWCMENEPLIEEWIGPGRKQVGGNGVYDNAYNGTHYACIGANEIPETPQPDPYVECQPITPGGDDYVLPIGPGPYTCDCGTYGPYVEPYVTEDCLAGDDLLGMVVTWNIRPEMYWHDTDPGPDGVFNTADDEFLPKNEVTAADMVWGLNLIRDQECDRYQTQWWFIYAVEQVDEYTVKVCEERRFLFAFEGHDVGFLAPKHIWEPFIEPTMAYNSLEITLPDGTTSYGDEITAWANHHEDWEGWEEPYIQDPGYRDPDTGDIAADAPWLTYLIGFGPFKYHLGGWEVGIGSHFEANRQYFAHSVCIGDVYFDQTCELPDWYLTMASVGEYRVDPNYDVKADICYPAQVIDTAEIYAVEFDHFGHYWGPPPVPGGFVYCDHSTCG